MWEAQWTKAEALWAEAEVWQVETQRNTGKTHEIKPSVRLYSLYVWLPQLTPES